MCKRLSSMQKVRCNKIFLNLTSGQAFALKTVPFARSTLMMSRSHIQPPLVVLALLAGSAGAFAQGASSDEAVNAHGAVTQTVMLTAAQRDAIYNAVVRQSVKTSANNIISLSVGAPVPPLAELRDLPDQAAAGVASPTLLKYAIVAGDVVVVDSIKMCVVEIIRDGEKP
jgi:hypothetical protein